MQKWLAVLVAMSLFGACDAAEIPSGLQIVVSTPMLGDLVSQVAGDGSSVEVLMPNGVDPHDFQASSRQISSISKADLVVVTGLGLEQGLMGVLSEAIDDDVYVLEVGDFLQTRTFSDGSVDPHVWLDPIRMSETTRLVGDTLVSLDRSGGYLGRAESYANELEALHYEIRKTLSGVVDRKLVTNHDSLGYFADQYRLEIIGTVIGGGSTLAEPSASEISDLVKVIEREDVSTIFVDSTETDELAKAVAAEIEGVAVILLYVGALGEPGSGSDSLIGMLRTNAQRIADALGEQ
jgi:zinc/manganese transport system substrate-binding protein